MATSVTAWSVSSKPSPPIWRTDSAAGPARRGAGLEQREHLAVVERHEAGGAHEVRLPQPPLGHGLVVVLVPEERPVQVVGADAAGHELAHGEGVRLLLHDEARAQRLHHEGDVATELLDDVEQRGDRAAACPAGRRPPSRPRRPRLAHAGCSRARSADPWRPSPWPTGCRRGTGRSDTRNTCSTLAWYGSLMFSSISFQLAGMRWCMCPRTVRARPSNTRSNQPSIVGPSHDSNGSTVGSNEANTTPWRSCTSRRRSGCSSSENVSGIPPLAADTVAERERDEGAVEAVRPLVVRAAEMPGVAVGLVAQLQPRCAHRFSSTCNSPLASRVRITERSPIDVVMKSPGSGTCAARPTKHHSGP